jgi:hypothetical protein
VFGVGCGAHFGAHSGEGRSGRDGRLRYMLAIRVQISPSHPGPRLQLAWKPWEAMPSLNLDELRRTYVRQLFNAAKLLAESLLILRISRASSARSS